MKLWFVIGGTCKRVVVHNEMNTIKNEYDLHIKNLFEGVEICV